MSDFCDKSLAHAIAKGKAHPYGLISSADGIGFFASDFITWQLVHGKETPRDAMDRFEAYEALGAVEPAPKASIDAVNEGFLFNAILTGHTTRMRHLVDQAHEHRAGTKNAWTSAARARPAKAFALWLAGRVLGRTIDLPQIRRLRGSREALEKTGRSAGHSGLAPSCARQHECRASLLPAPPCRPRRDPEGA